MSDIGAISSVQSSEKKAVETLEHAAKWKEGKIASAQEKAGKIVQDAEEEAKGIIEAASAGAMASSKSEKRRMLAEATKKADKIRKIKPSATMLKGVAAELVKKIIGE